MIMIIADYQSVSWWIIIGDHKNLNESVFYLGA